MAFCTSCGANIDNHVAFCTSCGKPAAATAGAVTTTATQTAAPVQTTKGGGGALKVILIVLAVVIGLGILMSVVIGFVGYRFMRGTRVEQNGNNATVTTPFGTVKTSDNPAEVARDLGVDVYPGARSRKQGAIVNFGGMKVANAEFESDDPPDKVGNFYRERFPKAMISTRQNDEESIVFSNDKGMITITIRPAGSGSRITIANVTGMKPGMVKPPARTDEN